MTWLSSVGVGFLTAIIGAFGTGFLGMLCVDWYRVSSREGGSGYMVVFMGLVGGLIGFIIGIVGSRIVASTVEPGFMRGLGVAAGSVVGLLAIITLVCWMACDPDTTLHGNGVKIHAEVRCPVGFALPAEVDADAWYAHIDTRSRRSTSYGSLRLKEARVEGGHLIVPMTLDLNTSVREKLLYVRLAENVQLFIPVFPSKPGSRYFEWSAWLDGGWETGKPRPTPEQMFRLRFRLEEVIAEKSVAGPIGPTEEEIQAAKKADESAALAALTPESPLEDCLKFTHYSQSEEVRFQAGAVIGKRPNVTAEMSEQILSPNFDISDRALRALSYIKPLPVELTVPVKVIGEKLMADMKVFNASKPEEDPHYQRAADASLLFAGWFAAHLALHENAGSDGLLQLQGVLELALKRPDSYVMKNDIARISQYYVKEWTSAPAAKK